jgi:PRTRC genetic system protein A
MFTKHMYATSPDLPPFGAYLCEYVTAANGVFARARRPGLEAMLPVCLNFNSAIRDLHPLTPYIRLDGGPIPASVIAQAVDRMSQAAPRELLTWVIRRQEYSLVVPQQTNTISRCKPLDIFDPLGCEALLDFHSHGQASPFFSPVDDRDERTGFRLFAVAGWFPEPKILVRLGIYGHFWQIPPDWVMELPDNTTPVFEGGLSCS